MLRSMNKFLTSRDALKVTFDKDDIRQMALFAGNLKEFLTIKVKVRNDDYSDQISRLVATKIFVLCTLVTCLDWFHDTFNCLPPTSGDKLQLPKNYLASVCWINGIYIYPELAQHMEKSMFYGIPALLEENGITHIAGKPVLCRTVKKFGQESGDHCKPMERLYFAQYQWMPFLIASMGLLYYLPYISFRIINTDMASLRNYMMREQAEVEEIVNNFFNYEINSPWKMYWRVLLNVVNKIFYFLVNYASFMILDVLLNGCYTHYGGDWIAWASENSTSRLNFNVRKSPAPGNKMLPTFGLCDLMDTRSEITKSYANKYIVMCEISSHLLYQYMLIILWFVMVVSMTVSILGLVLHLCSHLYIKWIVKRKKLIQPIKGRLKQREFEYLEFMRRRDLALYGKVLRKLQIYKLKNNNNNSDSMNGNGSLAVDYKELLVSESVT